MAVKKEITRTGWQEVAGILLLALCVLGILSLFSYDPQDVSALTNPPNAPPANFIGPVGAWFGFLSFILFGVCGYLVPAGLAYVGLLCLFKREGRIWTKALWMLGLLLAITALVDMSPLTWEALREKVNAGSAGGLLGDLLTRRTLVSLLGSVGTAILGIAVLLVSFVMLFEVRPVLLAHQVWDFLLDQYERFETWRKSRLDRQEQLLEEQREVEKRRKRLEEAMKGQDTPPAATVRRVAKTREPAPVVAPEPEPLVVAENEPYRAEDEPETVVPPPVAAAEEPQPELLKKAVDFVKNVRQKQRDKVQALQDEAAAEGETPALKVDKDAPPAVLPAASGIFTLPPLTILDALPPEKDRQVQTDDFSAGSQILKETLAEFGVEVDVTKVERGPVVTRYELLPAPGVRVERIAALGNNIGLAMKAESVRVQAPIPGKGVVGIEVPNPKTTTVYLREILESDTWVNSKAALPLALGKDVGGHVLVADLADMPHLLVAGATGSGKTVCMNSILAGLLISRTPEQMRLMLIDPKIVEFSGYNKLPHLVVPVITDSKKVALGLRWAITEMENRYKMFAKVGVRNIKSFNSRPIVKQTELFPQGAPGAAPEEEEEEPIPDRVPYIVIVVDELADLMLVAQADVENQIARLAQLSRAVGIHMILATQRPSVNVITGTIKANFPARISFQVAQKVDSRTILDATGADKLLGKGDMLFLPPGTGKLTRAQGTLTTDGEIQRVVAHLKAQGVPQYEMSIKDKIEGKTVDLPDMEEDDELLQQSMEIIRQTRRASTSSLQRRLRIGYTRAARIMDLLEQKGIVGPAQGSDPREILIDLDGEVPANTASGSDPEKDNLEP